MSDSEHLSTPEIPESALDRAHILGYLQELGMDIELEDWNDMDDNDILGNIATLALEYGEDIDGIFEALGIPIESGPDVE